VAGIRAVMVTTPAMLRDLIRQLAEGRIDLEIVAELDTRKDLVRRLKALRPALVVIGFARNEGEGFVRALLKRLPALRIIALGPDNRMTGYEFQLRRSRLDDRSPDGLISFIRAPSPEITGDGD
jgi:DNA-binding NarL/FixJ family response regulator